jgi:hypothetical protein
LRGLRAAELARLDTWALDIARHVRGSGREANGAWRFGSKGGLVVHPDAWFHDFSAGKGGRGGLFLISHLCPDRDPVAWAREWLGAHEGFGGCKPGAADDDDAAEALHDAERIAMIEAIWSGATPIDGTPAEAYLASRGLTPCGEDRAQLRWLARARGEEGALIVAFTANDGKIVAIQETFIDPTGRKSAVPPARKMTRGPHDWNKRGLARFGSAGGEKLHVSEGVEDALSARAHGAGRVVALAGVSRLGKSRYRPASRPSSPCATATRPSLTPTSPCGVGSRASSGRASRS